MFWALVLLLSALFFYYYLYKPQLYWRGQNVKQGPAIPLLGDTFNLLLNKESLKDMLINIYNRFKDARYSGIYLMTRPALMIHDPDLIKQLTVKDFEHFVDHRSFTSMKVDPLWANNLFGLKGDPWRQMRVTLSPTFTSSKMRAMFLLMESSARQYVEHYLNQKQEIIEVELRESFMRFANDVIANCSFGLVVDSLKEPENDFYINGKDITNFTKFSSHIIFWLNIISPGIPRALNLRFLPKKATDFFERIARDTIKLREEKNIIRPDVVHLLMEARKGRLKFDDSNQSQDAGFATVEESNYGKNSALQKFEFTDLEVASQMFVFFFGGFDTTSTMMSFMCYELAMHPEFQEKLHQEIDEAYSQNKGQLSYDIINKMKYLDMAVAENLRMHPPAPMIDRVCTKGYTIQPDRPDEKPVHMKPGDLIWIPIIALHHDEKYYENPEQFDPERFSDENKDTIKPYTYLPFGTGPRNCIGSRFALTEIKTLVFHLLRRFELTLIDKSPVPVRLVKGSMSMDMEGGFWVGMKQREMNA